MYYFMRKFLSLIVMLVMGMTMLMAQTKTVTGTVVSAEDGEPIIGASVIIPGTTTGTVTDIDGNFSLKVPENSTTLSVSFIGMETENVKIGKGKLNITLSASNEILDEVMVVAFGQAKKSAFTGSAAVVGSDELGKAQVTSVTSALAGAVPGVSLTSANGAPGSSATIRIRGISSINAGKDPLIIVDGATYSGDIANINPTDVESMTVLKDAASAALYGARGANGVIIITTKNAKKGQDAKVSFDAKWGGNTRALQHYETINDPAAYYEMQYRALNNYYLGAVGQDANAAWQSANKALIGRVDAGGLGYNIWTIPEGQMLIGQNGKLNPAATLGRSDGTFYYTPDDWEEIATRTGTRQEYNVSVNGSTDNSSTYLSLGYLKNEGITYKSDFERISARLRSDLQVKKWLKVGASAAYTNFEGNTLGENDNSTSTANVWAFTAHMAPIYPCYVRNADGSIYVDGNGIEVMDYGNGEHGGDRPFIQDANPIQDNLLNNRSYEGNSLSANAFADATLLPGLVLTVNAGINLNETRGTYYYNPYYGQFDSTGGTLQKYNSRTNDITTQQLLNYTTTFNDKHNLSILLGHEYYKYIYKYLTASKSQMFSDTNLELGGAVVDGQSAYSYTSVYNVEGYLARVQYDFDEKYFLSASFRRDASSRFAKENRWGSFWSLGGAWILTKENWLSDIAWLNQLKFKASYGSQGNDAIGNYRYTDQYNIQNSGGNVGVSFNQKGNKNITWETNNNLNAGIEATLWKKLDISAEVFYKKTTDMLLAFSVAPSLGYSSVYENVGDLVNKGFEMDLSYNIFRNKHISWDARFNLSYVHNEITKLHEDNKTSTYYDLNGKAYDGFTSGSFFRTEGQSVYSWRLKEFAGVDPETGASLWYKNIFETDSEGNLPKDADGNEIKNWIGKETTSVYADADYYVNNESTMPNWFGGFGTTVSAYGFDFSINCSFAIGGKQWDATYQDFMSNPTSSHGGYNFHRDLYNAWTKDNASSDVPRFWYADDSAGRSSTRWLTSASFLNIENVNIGYTLPRNILKSLQIDNLRIYCAAENLGYISARKGFDPRQTYSDASYGTRYAPMRTISGGISVTF